MAVKRRDPYSAPLGVPPIFSASDIPTPTVPTQLPPPFDFTAMQSPATQNVSGGEETVPKSPLTPEMATPESTLPTLPPPVTTPTPGQYNPYASAVPRPDPNAPPKTPKLVNPKVTKPPYPDASMLDPVVKQYNNLLANHWAPSRREDIIAYLMAHHDAIPNMDEIIAWWQTASDEQVWPYGKPGSEGDDAAPGDWTPDWFWGQWDKLIQQYPPTTEGLTQLIKEHPELKIKISGKGNIELPNGEFWDVIIGAGAGGGQWWKSRRGSGNDDGGGGGGGGFQPPISEDDELTRAINKKLIELIGGEGEYMRRYESAREKEALSFKAMMEDARAEMASRGFLGEPGNPSGEEANVIRRVTERVAPTFARETRDAYLDSQNFLLNAIGQGNARQQTLANIALGVLDRNIEWNKFLATYGLDRERLQHDIQNGNLDSLMPLIQAFIEYLKAAQQGYQPPDR